MGPQKEQHRKGALTFEHRRNSAEHRCAEAIVWYRHQMMRQRRTLKVTEILATVLGALIPVVLLADNGATGPRYVRPEFVAAAMAAAASIATTIAQTMHLRDNYIRFALTRGALERERSLYQSLRTAEYIGGDSGSEADEEGALAVFVRRVEAILANETQSWGVMAKGAERTTRRAEREST